jgi:hypothetical protein
VKRAEPQRSLVCTRCGASVECCAFCERENCNHAICNRCMRLGLRQSRDHPQVERANRATS